MCQYSANDGVPSPWHTTHLGMLANSGASLVVVEATGVERRGRITHGCTGIYSDACEDAFRTVIAHCKRIGTAKFGIQLAHAGRKASSARRGRRARTEAGEDPWETIGPSAVAPGAAWPTPRAMDEVDMAQVREAFIDAAKRSVRTASSRSSCTWRTVICSTASSADLKQAQRRLRRLARRPHEVSARSAARRSRRHSQRHAAGARISSTDWMDGG